GIRPRRAQDGAALEVNARQVVDAELDDVLDVSLDQPAKAVVAAEDTDAVITRLDRRGRDDGVDAGRRPAADENGQSLSANRDHVFPAYYAGGPGTPSISSDERQSRRS